MKTIIRVLLFLLLLPNIFCFAQAKDKEFAGQLYPFQYKKGGTFTYTNRPEKFENNPDYTRVYCQWQQGFEPNKSQGVHKDKTANNSGNSLEIIGSGTGFFISKDGWFVTCAHVAELGTLYTVRYRELWFTATLKALDKVNDLALLKIEGKFTSLPLALNNSVGLGDSVFTVGFPNPELQGNSAKLTRGDINSMAGISDDPRFFQTSVAVQPGNSGGALVKSSGEVVGIITSKLQDKATLELTGSLPQDVNYAIKSGLLWLLLEKNPEAMQSLNAETDVNRPGKPEQWAIAASGLLLIVGK